MEFLKKNSKNILIGILFILFISSCVFIFYLLNKQKLEIEKEIIGTVIISDKEYLMIEKDEENYLITNIKGTYEIGDKVKFTYLESEIDNEANPKKIKVNDEELIEKKKKENTEYNNESNNNDKETSSNEMTKEPNSSTNKNNSANNSNQNNNTTNSNNNTNNEKVENADIAVMNYMNTLQTEMDKPSLGESAKKGFITVIDFIFYNGTIKGHRFSELTNSVKLKVLSAALYFDSKIDNYFPGYKESISNTTKKIYTNVKEQIISAYLDITTLVCSSNNELCSSAKEGFQSLKKNFSLTFDLIKEIAGDGITNLKNWYEIWSGK